jgi:hypothetical protein
MAGTRDKKGFSIEAHNRSRTARAAICQGLASVYEPTAGPPLQEGYRRPEDLPVPMTDLERLLERLREHEVGYHLVAGRGELVELMANRLYARGGLKTLVDERDVVARCKVVEGLRQRLLDVTVEPVGGALLAEDAELGITPCAGLIAETGTLVLAAPDRPALAVSLLAARHFVVAEERQLVATLADWLAVNPPDGQHRVLLSGPSRTADIEKQVVIGVHGPWKVSLFILRHGWEQD